MRLTPDAQGSYINGTWSTDIAPMTTTRRAYPSNMLPSGKLLLLGGEFIGGSVVAARIGTGEIYDSVANTWTPIAEPPPVPNCPFVVAYNGVLVKGSPVVTGMDPPGTAGFQVGWTVTGKGIPTNTTILSVDSASQITLSQNATQSGPFQLTLTTTTTGNIVAGSRIVTGLPNAAGYFRVSTVSGSGIPAGALITSVDSSSQIHISLAATSTANGVALAIGLQYEPPICIGDDPTMLLPNGKVLVGGLTTLNPNYTNLYDPATNTWSPRGNKVYDASAEESWVLLDDGSVLTYDVFKSNAASTGYAELYNPTTNKWSSISPADGTAQGVLPYLTDAGSEMGPILRLQDGRIFAIGANGHTALYTHSTNTWAAGPDILGTLGSSSSPYLFGLDDAAAAILPNGHVILAGDAANGIPATGNVTAGSTVITGISPAVTASLQQYMFVFGSGIPDTASTQIVSVSPGQVTMNAAATATATGETITFASEGSPPLTLFDFDPVAGTISGVSPAIPDTNLLNDEGTNSRMLILPTGQLLFGDGGPQLWVYTPDGGPSANLLPTIANMASNGGGVYTLTGTQLSGQNAGGAYGDDMEMDENYPIVRLENPAGTVYYARTFNWSSSLVGISSAPQTVNFTPPAAVSNGGYSLIVSAAGISSNAFPFVLQNPPSVLAAGPGSGSGTTQTFTVTFSDPNGYQNLQVADVLINSALDGRHACYVAFQPATAGVPTGSGSVFLVDDAGDAGGPYQGLSLPGSGSVSNSQCTVNGAGSSVTAGGNTLTLALAITFSAAFTGSKVVYTSAQDKSAADSGWQSLSTWNVPGAAETGPAVGGMSPARSNSFLGPTSYTFTFTDSNGWQDISIADILVNSSIDGRQACYIAFQPSSNSLDLVDDQGDAGGPYQGLVLPGAPSGSGSVSNSQCTVNGGSVSGSGNNLTLTLSIAFNQSFAGNRIFYLSAGNNAGQNSNWQAVGSTTVP